MAQVNKNKEGDGTGINKIGPKTEDESIKFTDKDNDGIPDQGVDKYSYSFGGFDDEFFDRQLYFIWYDIIPREVSANNFIQYSRFQWRYHDPSTGIVTGIENFKKTWEFVNRDPDKRPRRQKRNDDESSNHRK